MNYTPVLIVIGIMLVGGTIAAVVWWTMADVLFPGASKKTGQRILGSDKKREGPPPGATIVRGFDEPPQKPS